MNYSYTITKDVLTIYIGGDAITIPRNSFHARNIEREIREKGVENLTKESIQNILSRKAAYEAYSGNDISITEDGTVTRNGVALPKALAEQVAECHASGVPYTYLVNFFDKLNRNPSKRSFDYLCAFLEHRQMPITKDGNFLAYKAVTSDWVDKHTRTISNRVGDNPSVPRNQVCDDPSIGCSHGLHAGSLAYARGFAHGDNRIVIVSINPEHVVCVPYDCQHQKLRTSEYKVVAEYKQPLSDGAVSNEDAPYETSFKDGDEIEDILEKLRGCKTKKTVVVVIKPSAEEDDDDNYDDDDDNYDDIY